MNNTSIQMFINGEEVVCNKDFTIKEEFLNTASTILNNCYPKSWELDKDYTSRFFLPLDYSTCRILRNNVLFFAGLVKNSGNIALNPREPKYASLQILDYKTLLSEGKTLDFVIAEKTITEAITMVINAIADYGFILGTVNILNDDVIGAYSTLNKTAYDVFQYLAEISQSRWTTRMIDESTTAIDFYDPTLLPSASDILYTTEFFEENNIVDISYSFGTRDYRNKQAIVSNLVYANLDNTETLISNGYDKIFKTEQPIGVIKNVYVNSVVATVATNDQKLLGIYADFYYTPGDSSFYSNTDNAPYIAGTTIQVIYTPLVKGREIVYNNSEISRIGGQMGRNGTISRYENRNDLLSSAELQQVGQAYIKFKGKPEIILTVITHNNDILNIGQQVYFDIPGVPLLNTDYMVKVKETVISQTGDYSEVFYHYQLSSTFEGETAINYFDNQRRKSTGNINESEYITRNIDIENTANIVFKELTTDEVVMVGDNVLDCVLDSPLTN